MKFKKFLLAIIFIFGSISASASDFFSTEDANKFFTFGGRLGFNTSNRTMANSAFTEWNHNSWGLGFDAGVVASLNFKNYLSIQPGLFFESRSGDYAYATAYITNMDKPDTFTEMGHMRSYYLTLPVMAVVNFNLAENIRWSVEVGPYFQFCLQDSGHKNITVLDRYPQMNDYFQYNAENNSADVGLKLGTGLQFNDHYYVGVHYKAGFCNAWSKPEGGRNKAWLFTIGYDF